MRRVHWPKTLALAVLAISLLLSWSWANVGPLSQAGDATPPLCYCGCDAKTGAHACPMMCDLPQYKNRAWAISCQRSKPVERFTNLPKTPSQSNRPRRIQSASR